MAKNENTEAAAPSRLGVWFQHHVHSVVFSLGRACRKPWATLLTVMVMALALALPLGLSIALDNLKQFAGSVQQSRDINLFLKTDVDAAPALRLATDIVPAFRTAADLGWDALVAAHNAGPHRIQVNVHRLSLQGLPVLG